MAGEQGVVGTDRRALGAVLFLQASANAFDAFSALNSSPWTAESFGGTPDKAKSCREYVYHAAVVTSFYGIAAAVIAQSVWPIVGTVLALVYMIWLYWRAIRRGIERESTTWKG